MTTLTPLQRAVVGGDAVALRQLLDPDGLEMPSAAAWASIIDSEFAEAAELAATGADFASQAVCLLAQTMQGAAPEGALDQLCATAMTMAAGDLATWDLWGLCMLGEAAMSAGRLEVAETLARHTVSLADRDDATTIFALQSLARALLFQGRLAESADAIATAEAHPGADEIGALALVLAGTGAYLAALTDDRVALRRRADAIDAGAATSPQGYLSRGALVLSAYAFAAAGDAERAAQILLRGAGGPRLSVLQSVDRAYGYELLIAAALTVGDLQRARQWLRIARRVIASDASGMAGAALQRSSARVAAAEGEPGRSADHAALAAALADDRAGHLDATRARLLSASALLHGGDSAQAQERLNQAGIDATAMGAVSLILLARRDLRSIGLRFAGAEQTPMSLREREVAELMIAGRSNAEIAKTLTISERTVHSHVAAVLRALGVPSRAALATVLQPPSAGDTAGLLTARQRQVAEFVSRGFTNEGISRELGLSVKTVEKHLGDAYRRLGVDSRAALAARWAGRSVS